MSAPQTLRLRDICSEAENCTRPQGKNQAHRGTLGSAEEDQEEPGVRPEDVVEEHDKDGDGKIVLSEFNAVAADEEKPDCCT